MGGLSSLGQRLGPQLGFHTLAPALNVMPAATALKFFAWYDASQITGFADNSGLTTWHDASGHGHDLTHSTSPPRYFSTTPSRLVNGLPAVWGMTGFADYIETLTGFIAGLPLTVAVVTSGVTNPNVNPGVFFGGAGAEPFLQLSNTPGAGYWLMGNSGVKAGTVDTLTHVVICTVTATTGTITVDGATTSGAIAPTGYSSGIFQLFVTAAGTGNLFGAICEVQVKSGKATPSQIAALYASLKAKWGAV